MRKFFIALVLIVAAAFGGIKLYFWYQVTQAADAMVAALRPVAQVSYGGTIATLGGKLGIEDIEIRPAGSIASTTIEAVTFQADNLWELYNVSTTIQEGRLPPQLQINVVNMAFGPGSEMWQQYVGSPNVLAAVQHRFEALNCGNRTGFSGSDYVDMGIHEISVSMHAGYRFHPEEQTISLYLDAVAPDINQGSLRVDFATNSNVLRPQALRMGLSRLAGGQLKMTDLGWNAKVRKFCAAETGATEAEYVAGYADAVWHELSVLGVDAGNTLKKSYRDFLMSDGGHFKLSLNAAYPIDLKNLRFYAANDIVQLLNPTLAVNGQPVSLSGIKFHEVLSSDIRQSRSSQTGTENEGENYTFSSFPLDQLDRHLHQRVRLETNLRIFEGKLISIEDRYVTLELQSYSGTRDVIVALRDINSAAAAKLVERASELKGRPAPAI